MTQILGKGSTLTHMAPKSHHFILILLQAHGPIARPRAAKPQLFVDETEPLVVLEDYKNYAGPKIMHVHKTLEMSN